MKVLCLLLVAGLGLAAALPLFPENVALESDVSESLKMFVDDLDEQISEAEQSHALKENYFAIMDNLEDEIHYDFSQTVLKFKRETDETPEALYHRLRKEFLATLKKVKRAYDREERLRGEIIGQVFDTYHELKDRAIPIGVRAMDLVTELADKADGIMKKFWIRISESRQRFYDLYSDNNDDMKTELGRKLKAHLEELLEHVRDIVDNGRAYKEDLAKKAQEIHQHLKDMGMEISNHAKKLIEKMKTKAKGLWRKFLDKFTPNHDAAHAEDEPAICPPGPFPYKTSVYRSDFDEGVKNTLQKKFHETVEELKNAYENGKEFIGPILLKITNLYEEMLKKSVSMGEKTKEMIRQLQEKTTGFWKMIFEKLGEAVGEKADAPEDFEILYQDENDVKTELGKKLRGHFDEIVEHLKDIMENGKAYKEDLVQKGKEIRDKLKDMGMDIGDHAKELLNKLKAKAKGFWKKILNKLSPDHTIQFAEDQPAICPPGPFPYTTESSDVPAVCPPGPFPYKTDEKTNLRDRFNEILVSIKDAFENRKTIAANALTKLKEIYEEMKEKSIPMGEKAREMIEQLKEKASGFWKRILDKITPTEAYGPEDFEILFGDEAAICPPGPYPYVEEQRTDCYCLSDLQVLMSDNENVKTELGQKLKAHFDEIMVLVKDIVDNGKAYKEDLAQKAKEIRQKLKDMGMDISDHAKQLVNKLKEKAKGMWKKFLSKLSPDHHHEAHSDDEPAICPMKPYHSSDVMRTDEESSELQKKVNEILDAVKDAFENRKAIAAKLITKLKELYQEMKEKSIPLNERAKELIEQLKEKAHGFWKSFLEKISPSESFGPEDFEIQYVDDEPAICPVGPYPYKSECVCVEDFEVFFSDNPDVKTELGKKLRAHFDEIMEHLKDIIENGKAYKEDLAEKAKDVRQKLKDLGMDIGDHAKELINKLKSKAKDYWKTLLNKLNPKRSMAFADDNNDVKTELGEKLKAHFDEILGHLKDIIENGKAYKEDLIEKAKDIRHKLNEMGIDIGNHAKQLINKLKSKAKDYWKKILNKINPDDEIAFADDFEEEEEVLEEDIENEELVDRFNNILEVLKDSFENNKPIDSIVIRKFQAMWEKIKRRYIPLTERAKELVEQLKKLANNFWKQILEKISDQREFYELF